MCIPEKSKGGPLDDVIGCSAEREEQQDRDKDCTVVTAISPWQRMATIFHPIYVINEPFPLVGVVAMRFSWDSMLEMMLNAIGSSGSSGVTAVLQSGENYFSWHLSKGQIEFL